MITKAKINGCAIINAQQVLTQLDAMPDWSTEVNRLEIDLGAEPGKGTFLISREDFDANWPETEAFSIELNNLELKGFVTVHAQQAFRMVESPMLVTVADRRHVWKDRVTSKKWADGTSATDILADLETDLNGSTFVDLVVPAIGTQTFNEAQYDGVPTLKAIEDFAFRCRGVVLFDPIADRLKIAKIDDTQAAITGDLFRDYQAAPVSLPLGWLNTLSMDGDIGLRQIHNLGGADSNSRSITVWTMASVGSGTLTAEINKLKLAAGDLASRQSAAEIKEFFDFKSAVCGGEISKTAWQMHGPLPTTIIWRTAPAIVMVGRVRFGGGGGTVFPVTLTQVGGVDGTRTTIATWTYNVRKIGEVVDLFSAINPVTAPHQYARESLGQRTKATYGLCALDASDNPFVLWINETIGVTACDIPVPPDPDPEPEPQDGLEEEFL